MTYPILMSLLVFAGCALAAQLVATIEAIWEGRPTRLNPTWPVIGLAVGTAAIGLTLISGAP